MTSLKETEISFLWCNKYFGVLVHYFWSKEKNFLYGSFKSYVYKKRWVGNSKNVNFYKVKTVKKGG